MTIAQPGTWVSPITPEMLSQAGISMGFIQTFEGEVFWDESRPNENGRNVVVSRTQGDILPAPWNASTRVHEIGGLSWLVCKWNDEAGLIFAEKSDQRIYWKSVGGEPEPITPESLPGTLARYSDFLIRGSEIWCVREVTDGATTNRDLIAINSARQLRVLDSASHFYAHLALSPDEQQLAWISWEHPQMPWDGTELWIANIDESGNLIDQEVCAGSQTEAVNSPVWTRDGTLYFISDASGFWNVWELDTRHAKRQVVSESAEWAHPMWVVGTHLLRILNTGEIVGIHGNPAHENIAIVDPRSGTWRNLECELTNFSHFSVQGDRIYAIGGAPKTLAALVELSTGNQKSSETIKEVLAPINEDFLPTARALEFPSKDGRTVHAFMSPATNPNFVGDELPPVIITVHGGPTGNTSGVASIKRAFFTSRGFTVVDVDYGGSTGYGRAYRETLKGQWGVVDTEDILAVVAGLIADGLADPKKIVIRGGSAGGYAVLNGLVHSKVFAAGANYYGVAELIMLAEDTHDFESRYLDSLIGPYPERKDLYVERSPLTYAENLTSPLIIFQGSDDPIVPPSQSQAFRDACIKNGIKHKYFEFEGESHGFGKSQTISTCAIEELKFFGEVLGFVPAE
jgi:dipeptidyl aminopeptidase/acylaminoacyl peptidase